MLGYCLFFLYSIVGQQQLLPLRAVLPYNQQTLTELPFLAKAD